MSVIQKWVFTMNCNDFLGNFYSHTVILSLPFVSVLLSDEKHVYMHIRKNTADTLISFICLIKTPIKTYRA